MIIDNTTNLSGHSVVFGDSSKIPFLTVNRFKKNKTIHMASFSIHFLLTKTTMHLVCFLLNIPFQPLFLVAIFSLNQESPFIAPSDDPDLNQRPWVKKATREQHGVPLKFSTKTDANSFEGR